MELNKQVVSLELARKLRELGFTQDSVWHWKVSKNEKIYLRHGINFESSSPRKGTRCLFYSAFSVAELGEMLPQVIESNMKPPFSRTQKTYQLTVTLGLDKQWFVVYTNINNANDNAEFPIKMCHNEADARAKMLIWLKENNYLDSSHTEVKEKE